MVTDAAVKDKGKVARKVAQNAAICVRYDALHQGELNDISQTRVARCSLEQKGTKLQKQDKLDTFKLNLQAQKEQETKTEKINKGVVEVSKDLKKEEKKEVKEEKPKESKKEVKEEKPKEEKPKDEKKEKEEKHKNKEEK